MARGRRYREGCRRPAGCRASGRTRRNRTQSGKTAGEGSSQVRRVRGSHALHNSGVGTGNPAVGGCTARRTLHAGGSDPSCPPQLPNRRRRAPAPFPRATVLHARAEDVTLDVDGIWFDPARRHTVAGPTTRLHDPQAYCPPLSFVWDLAAHTPLGVKLGPGTDRSVIPPPSEAQWVSVDGNLVELAVWCGSLARSGVRRAALVIRGNSHHELTGESDAADVPVGPLGEYLYEPDGAVIRARQIGALARTHAATMISDGIAYLTSDRQFHSPFVRGFRVLEQLPGDERHLRQALAARRIGVLDIKKRGVGIDPAALRKRLRLKGDASATVVMTRVGGRHLTLLVERITEPQ